MDYKNETNLRGDLVSITPLRRGERTMYRLQLKTERAYRNREGKDVIKKDIHTCYAWPGKTISADMLRALHPGNVIYITGYLQTNYLNVKGAEKPVQTSEVWVRKITISKQTTGSLSPSVTI